MYIIIWHQPQTKEKHWSSTLITSLSHRLILQRNFLMCREIDKQQQVTSLSRPTSHNNTKLNHKLKRCTNMLTADVYTWTHIKATTHLSLLDGNMHNRFLNWMYFHQCWRWPQWNLTDWLSSTRQRSLIPHWTHHANVLQLRFHRSKQNVWLPDTMKAHFSGSFRPCLRHSGARGRLAACPAPNRWGSAESRNTWTQVSLSLGGEWCLWMDFTAEAVMNRQSESVTFTSLIFH